MNSRSSNSRASSKYIPVCGLFLWTENYPERGGDGGLFTDDGQIHVHFHLRKEIPSPSPSVALYIYGEWPPDQIDHIDGEPSNNRLDNLRLATNSENQQNRKKSNNTSGAKGVCKIRNRFKAHIGVRGKVKNLGTYGTFNEAADAYKTAAAQYFGEFARPEVGEYKPPSIKRKVISAELPKRTVDAMSRMWACAAVLWDRALTHKANHSHRSC